MNDRASHIYPFHGGIAGKLGDRFEAKWAVKKFFEVILGDADALQFEFVDPVNHGVEFWLSKNGCKEWYQAKRQNTQGNWTIGRLAREGVLAAAKSKLAATPDDRFFFLSTAPATVIQHLAQRAATIESGADAFLGSLTDEDRASHLPELERHWEADAEQTWRYLRRFDAYCEPEPDLDINIKMLGGQVFSAAFEHFFPLLREYLENNFNRLLTTEIVRREIIEAGILAPRAPLDPTLRDRIAAANHRYLDSYIPFGAGGSSIARKETKEILSLLEAEVGPTVTLLTGNAGTGKSGVIREVLAGLTERGITYLAFRVDHRMEIDSSFALGNALYDRHEGPVSTLQALEPNRHAVLFIDQIDAISEVSGRTSPIREVIFELLRFASFSGNIRILAACRIYDLNNDGALLALEKEHRAKRIEVKPLDWETEIEPLLRDKGISVGHLTPNQRKLLALPLNLALFLETTETNGLSAQFHSTTELLGRLITKKQRTITARGFHDFALMPILSELAAAMSRDQTLDAPASALDRFPNALDLLATEHLVCQVKGRINFFHESLFDYAFARGFVTERLPLLDLLQEDEQHLFRRTQVRQILAMYREVGPQSLYLAQLRDLLVSSSVRYHLKDAVVRWLGGIEAPTEAELDVILALDTPNKRMPPLVRIAIYPQSVWLPILLGRGLIAEWLEASDEERRGDALQILRNALKSFPTEVANALRAWWQNDPVRGAALFNWFSWLHDMQPCRELLELNLDLIRSNPEGVFNRNGLYNRHSLSAWIKHDSDAAGELLRVWFETWYTIFPTGHPFKNDRTNDLDYHWLEELHKKSVGAFLKAAIPAFVEAIRRINASFDGQRWIDYTWQLRFDQEGFGSDRFLVLLRTSLCGLAQTAPDQAIGAIKQIDPFSHPAALNLWLETIGNAGHSLGNLLPSLLGAEWLFVAGPNGAEWLSFARATNAALPHLPADEQLLSEDRIMTHWPELSLARKICQRLANGEPEEEPFWTRKSVIYDLNRNGYEQWCILKSINKEFFSPAARQRLSQLDRKFIGKTTGKPNDLQAMTVPPPIGDECAKRMSDASWLKAIDAYRDNKEGRHSRDDWSRDTGSRGLAQILREQTKENPERFARFLRRLPSGTPEVYFNEILNGLAESQIAEEMLVSVIRYAHSLSDRPCCEGISRLLKKYPALANHEDIFQTLVWYVENGPAATDAQSDAHRTQELLLSADRLTANGGFLQVRGGYRDRGFAVEALADVLWDCAVRTGEGVSILRKRIGLEPLASIRCLLTHPLYAVLRHDNRSAAELLRELVIGQGGNLLPLATYHGLQLLYYILHGVPEIGHELLDLLLSAENEGHRILGSFHLLREAFYDESLASRAEALAKQSDEHRKLAANAAANHLPHAAYRAKAEQQLMEFFNDPLDEIRAEAAECFRWIWDSSFTSYRVLASTFIQSKAFEKHGFAFFHLLQNCHEPVTTEVLLAAERALELAETPSNEPSLAARWQEMHYLDELLLREYAATENQPELRTRILNIIDRMLILGLYGTDKIILEHERL